ncbi:hypothetical protein [Spirosoma rigui]|uniref:hypothetical protein n=1 Tax=Spirosoma rigui TaxID=564064 RepID=UPI0009B178CC|nr:hypothetical protein [Spirosoma rigui]
MKIFIYALILPLVVVSGRAFVSREIKHKASEAATLKPPSATERKGALKKWEATPDGMKYKKWEVSPDGKKVYAGEAKLRKHINTFTSMDAVVTSLSLPAGSRLGFGLMVRIEGEDYILSFGTAKADRSFLTVNNEFQQLHKLNVNDKIRIRSHSVSHAPKYPFPILSGDYIERDSKIIYKRAPRQGGC